MRCYKNLHCTLLAMTLLFSPFMAAHAFQATATQQQSTQSTHYLSGELLSWYKDTLKTSIGEFNIGNGVSVLDHTQSRDRSYIKQDTKPKVQLTFSDKRLIKVVIYQ